MVALICSKQFQPTSNPTSYNLIFKQAMFFSSPELKAQVSFSDHLSSVCLSVCPPVRPSVCLSVCLSVNFSHFHLLLQNHWANFNQTWHKVSLGEGDSSLFKLRATPFPRGYNYKIAKNHCRI